MLKNVLKVVVLSVTVSVSVGLTGGQVLAFPSPVVSGMAHSGPQLYAQSAYGDLQKGSALADQGQYAEALPYFHRATEKNPASVLSQYNLGYSLMQLGLSMPQGPQRTEVLSASEWAFQRVRDLNPDLTLTYFKLGKLALLKKDYQAACDYYEAGTEVDPQSASLWFDLGAAYEKVNNLPGAEKAYLTAIQASPTFVFAHNNLGLLYEETGRPEKAEALYREALKAVPEYNYARLNLGSLLETQGRIDEAQALFQDAVRYEPENAFAHLYLGNMYYRKSNYEAAYQEYQKSIALNPKYATAYYLASLALEKLHRVDEALSDGMHYINMEPNGTFSHEAGELIMTLQQSQKKDLP